MKNNLNIPFRFTILGTRQALTMTLTVYMWHSVNIGKRLPSLGAVGDMQKYLHDFLEETCELPRNPGGHSLLLKSIMYRSPPRQIKGSHVGSCNLPLTQDMRVIQVMLGLEQLISLMA